MLFIAAFGFLMLLLSLCMVLKPHSFSNGIIFLSEKPYFHVFEIVSRIVAGMLFVTFADQTLFPKTFTVLGYGLFFVGLGLMLTPPRLHRTFAVWSAHYCRDKFRLIGLASLPLSIFLMYAAIGNI